MSQSVQREIGHLVSLAKDRSVPSRSALVAEITGLYCRGDVDLTEADREIMADIMNRLIREVEDPVRRTLAHLFAERADAPRELIVALANDTIEVARPVLTKSELLNDNELIDIIALRTMEHHLAIAIRRVVSEPVSDALVDTDHEEVIATLLANRGAAIAAATMERLVEQAHEVPRYQRALVERHDLSLALAKRLYHGVSDALREQILDRFEIDPAELDRALDNAVDTVFAREVQAVRQRHTAMLGDGEEGLPRGGAGVSEALLNLLRQGHVQPFIEHLSKHTGLRPKLMRRILFETGGDRLAVACKAIGLDKHAFVTIFLRARQGRLGEQRVDEDELARAVGCFDAIETEKAQGALRLWRQSRDA